MHFQEVRIVCTHIVHIYSFILLCFPHVKTLHLMPISFLRRPSLLLGPESIWTTWAGNKRTKYFHTPNHSVSAGHSICPDICRWRPQLCPHPLRSCVWLGAQQVWSAGSQWHQWWVVKTLKYLWAFNPLTLTNWEKVFCRSVFPSPAEVP